MKLDNIYQHEFIIDHLNNKYFVQTSLDKNNIMILQFDDNHDSYMTPENNVHSDTYNFIITAFQRTNTNITYTVSVNENDINIVFSDDHKQIEFILQKVINHPVENNKQLNNIAVSAFHDRIQVIDGEPVLSLKFNKIHKHSKIYVQANISVYSQANVYFDQEWNYGDVKYVGQKDSLSVNDCKTIMSTCVIDNHTVTGLQELKLYWLSENERFLKVNPDASDHIYLSDNKTCSTIRIEEIV